MQVQEICKFENKDNTIMANCHKNLIEKQVSYGGVGKMGWNPVVLPQLSCFQNLVLLDL